MHGKLNMLSDEWTGNESKNVTGVLLEYPTTTGFQWGHLKNDPYTYTVSEGNGRVFYNLCPYVIPGMWYISLMQ